MYMYIYIYIRYIYIYMYMYVCIYILLLFYWSENNEHSIMERPSKLTNHFVLVAQKARFSFKDFRSSC